MKKKIIMIVACVMCCAGLFGGCGQSGMKTAAAMKRLKRWDLSKSVKQAA